MNRKEEYWLYLEPFVHLNVRNDKALLYNTISGDSIIIHEKFIIDVLKKLINIKNLYVIGINNKVKEHPLFDRFINELKDYYMGDIIKKEISGIKPSQILPQIKINNSVELLRNNKYALNNLTYINNLVEITIYLSYSNTKNHNLINSHKQFPSFIYSNIRKNINSLNFSQVKFLLEQAKHSSLNSINVCRGSYIRNQEFSKIMEYLTDMKDKTITFFQHYLEIESNYLFFIQTKPYELIILFSKPINIEIIKNVINKYKQYKSVIFQFIIENKEQAEIFSKLIIEQKISDKQIRIIPYFNGINNQFFNNYLTQLSQVN